MCSNNFQIDIPPPKAENIKSINLNILFHEQKFVDKDKGARSMRETEMLSMEESDGYAYSIEQVNLGPRVGVNNIMSMMVMTLFHEKKVCLKFKVGLTSPIPFGPLIQRFHY